MSVQCIKIPIEGYIKQGDTVPSYTIELKNDETSNYEGDLTTATIKMQVYDGNEKIIDISNGNGITVINSNKCQVDQVQNNTLPIGTFKGDFEVTEADGTKTTYFNVQYTIVEQYTV